MAHKKPRSVAGQWGTEKGGESLTDIVLIAVGIAILFAVHESQESKRAFEYGLMLDQLADIEERLEKLESLVNLVSNEKD